MGRKVWTILGGSLAGWFALMGVGSFFALLKAFFVIGLIAVAVIIVVLVAARRRRHVE